MAEKEEAKQEDTPSSSQNNNNMDKKAAPSSNETSATKASKQEAGVTSAVPANSPKKKKAPPSNGTTSATTKMAVSTATPPGKDSNETDISASSPEKKASPTKGKGAGKASNLSELARQLRVMQAKNQTLTVEIGRLERQLRIVAELSGVSVSELRGTLQRACESEAYGELQHRLESMQAQLEEAKLKQRKAVEFDREAEAKKTANLQLRIGELEESEGALRTEIGQLYKSQDEQADEATKLKIANDQQTQEISRLKEQIEQLESSNKKLDSTNKKLEQEAKSPVMSPKRKVKDPPAHQSNKHSPQKAQLPGAPLTKKVKDSPTKQPASPKKALPATSAATPEKTLPEAPLVKKETEEVPTVDAKARAPTLSTTPAPYDSKLPALDNFQVNLLRKQVESRENELALKESQYKTRFSLQEERIVDMEQQLSSLYTAFEMLDQEHSQDQRAKEELSMALRMADSQVAKAVDHLQRSSPNTKQQPGAPSSPTSHNTAMTPGGPPVPAGYSSPPAAVQRSTKASSPQQHTAASANSTGDVLVSSYVMKRSRLNRWKTKYATLSRGFANFQLRLSDGPGPEGSRKKSSAFDLVVFRASFVATKEFSNYPYAFRIKTDRHDKNSQELVLSVRNEEEFKMWLGALHQAVNGSGSLVTSKEATPIVPPSHFSSGVVTPPRQDNNAHDFAVSSTDNDSDLEAALAESLRLSQEASSTQQHQSSDTPARPNKMPTQVGETKDEFRDHSESDVDLKAALAESLLVSTQASSTQQQSAGAQAPPPPTTTPATHFEETKEEIRDHSESDVDLKAALAESLLVSNQANQAHEIHELV